MKKLIFSLLFVLVGLATFAQLGAALTVAKANTLYPKISDGVNPYTYVYSKTQMDALLKNNFLSGIKAFNSNVKALPLGINDIMGATYTMVDGSEVLSAFYVSDTIVVNTICWVLQTQGNFTGDNYNGFAICSVSGTTYTKIVQTVSDDAVWKTAATAKGTKALPSATTLVPGAYIVVGLWNASSTTTAPIIYHMGTASVSGAVLMGGSHKFTAIVAAQTAIGATITTAQITGTVGNIFGLWLE